MQTLYRAYELCPDGHTLGTMLGTSRKWQTTYANAKRFSADAGLPTIIYRTDDDGHVVKCKMITIFCGQCLGHVRMWERRCPHCQARVITRNERG